MLACSSSPHPHSPQSATPTTVAATAAGALVLWRGSSSCPHLASPKTHTLVCSTEEQQLLPPHGYYWHGHGHAHGGPVASAGTRNPKPAYLSIQSK